MQELYTILPDFIRRFYQSGICGADLTWALTGSALMTFTRYARIHTDDSIDQPVSIRDFLRHFRYRLKALVLEALLAIDGVDGAPEIDTPTLYYVRHRSSFGLRPVQAIKCEILARTLDTKLDDLLQHRLFKHAGKSPALSSSLSSIPFAALTLSPLHRRALASAMAPKPTLIDEVTGMVQDLQAQRETQISRKLTAIPKSKLQRLIRIVQILVESSGLGGEERPLLERLCRTLELQSF